MVRQRYSLWSSLSIDDYELFSLPEMQKLDLADIFFRKDGATFHIARETMDL